MNERILELADEAGIKFSAHWAHEGVDTAVIIRRDLKEFAELIVRECLDITDAHKKVFQTHQDKSFIEYIKQSVKQHFGVEE